MTSPLTDWSAGWQTARAVLAARCHPRPAQEDTRAQDGPGTLLYCDPPYLHSTRAPTA